MCITTNPGAGAGQSFRIFRLRRQRAVICRGVEACAGLSHCRTAGGTSPLKRFGISTWRPLIGDVFAVCTYANLIWALLIDATTYDRRNVARSKRWWTRRVGGPDSAPDDARRHDGRNAVWNVDPARNVRVPQILPERRANLERNIASLRSAVVNGQAGLRWLSAGPPSLARVRESLEDCP
jgi:hypothetical protein